MGKTPVINYLSLDLLIEQNRPNEAFAQALEILRAHPQHVGAHSFLLSRLCGVPVHYRSAVLERYFSQLNCADAEQAVSCLATRFADHPDRYELFVSLGSLLVTQEHDELAICAFAHCLRPTSQGQRQHDEIHSEYRASSEHYNVDKVHGETAAIFVTLLRECLPQPRHGLTIIDAACGSGLAADTLRPWAETLIGLDLSPDMLNIARATGLYDDLICGDMVGSLQRMADTADLITCAGATYYVADIQPFLAAAAAALKPGGHLFFSDYPADSTDTVMQTIDGTLRHCRSAALMRKLAAAQGLSERHLMVGLAYNLPCYFWLFSRP